MKKSVLSLTLVIITFVLSAQSYSEYKLPEEGKNYYNGKGYYIESKNEKIASIQYFNLNKNKEVNSGIKFSKPEMLQKVSENQKRQIQGKDTHHVTLRFDIMTFSIYMTSEIHSYVDQDFSWSGQHKTAEIDVPEGIYDIMVNQYDFMNTGDILYVFLHNLNVNTDIDTSINLTESAKNYVYFHGRDENNIILSPEDTTLMINDKQISVEFPAPLVFQSATGDNFGFSKDYVRFSDVDPSYKIRCGQGDARQGKMYVLNLGLLNGISGDTVLESNPADYRQMATVFHESPSAVDDYLTFSTGLISRLRDDPYYTMYSYYNPSGYPSHNDDTLMIYLSNIFQQTNLTNLVGSVSFFENQPEYYGEKKITTKPFYIIPGDSIQFCWFYPPAAADYNVPDNAIVNFGNSAPFINIYSVNDATNIFNYSDVFGQCNEDRTIDDYSSLYYIKQGTDILQSDTLCNFIQPYTIPSAGPYSFSIVDSNYHINGVQGNLQSQVNFNLPSDDPNPPVLTSFKVLNSDGLICESFLSDEQASLHFSAADFINNGIYNISGAYLYYKKYDEETWISLPVQEIPEFYDSIFLYGQYFISNLTPVLNAYTDTTFLIDLKLILADAANNVTKEIFHPAFFVKNNNGVGISEPTLQNKANLNIYPNPVNNSSIVSFTLPRCSTVKLSVYNVSGQLINTLLDKKMDKGTHQINWAAADNSGRKLNSGIYFLKLETGNVVETIKVVVY